MATEIYYDISQLDGKDVIYSHTDIRARNPHRFEMELLDGIIHYDPGNDLAVGFHDLKENAWWTRGHIPGSPIFPGALMVEAAGQLSSFCYQERFGPDDSKFFGFGGIDKVKFRGMAKPGERLVLLCKGLLVNRRFSRFGVQGVVNGQLIFEGQIKGVAMPVKAKLDGIRAADA